MKTWKKCAAGLLAFAGWTPSLWAQVAAPAAPAAPAVPAAAAAAPAPGGLWTFLGLSKPQLAACKEKMCKMQIGILLNNSMAPIRAFTGGVVPDCCPVVSAADLAKPATSAEGAAAAIMADEAGAKARRAAVRYLGTVDCHYWPEAEVALINALRADKNECVRMEAAWALGSGCCCTKKTVEALAITVSGSDRDGNAAERSERVKEAARFALARCVACFNSRCAMEEDVLPAPKEPAPKESFTSTEEQKKPDNRPYYEKISTIPDKEIYERARQLLETGFEGVGPTADISDRSVFGVMQAAFHKLRKAPAPNAPTAGSVAAMTRPPQPINNTMALAMNQPKTQPGYFPPHPSVAAKAERPAPRGLLAVVRENLNHASQDADTARLPQAAVVSVERPVERAEQPALATAYRTITYHKPADRPEEVKTVSHQLPPGTFLPDLVKTLQRGTPKEREWAAQCLHAVDGRAHPEVVQALAMVCRVDTVPEVRASCVRSLVCIDVSTPEVVEALRALQNDPNPEVRLEAHRALSQLDR